MAGYLMIFMVAATFSFNTMADHIPVHLADENFIAKQKLVYELLWHVDQADIVRPELYAEAKKWDISANNESFHSQTVVTDFVNIYNAGMLPRGEIFSVFYPHMLDEAIALVRLFRSAVDFKTFWKTAAWARVHVNEGLFIYAFSVAVVHREDTKYLRLPTPDELNPYFFFNSDVLRQAHLIKMKHSTGGSGESYIIPVNHSLWYTPPRGCPEQRLSYFTEDVDLSAYHHILSLEYPFWMSSDEFNLPKGSRGEQYYYSLKLLLTRYNLERLSNGLNIVEDIEWTEHIGPGYHPFMTYQNGIPFPHRHHNSIVPTNKYKYIRELRNLENRILAIIDSGFYVDVEGKSEAIYTPEGFDLLGNIIEGNTDSLNEKFYGSIDAVARNILGFNPEPFTKHKVIPSVLQHFGTSLRDPMFYRLCKKIVGYFNRYKANLEHWTPEQLGASSGLKINSVLVDKLETYFDYSDSVINNAVAVRDNADAASFVIKARRYNLNHKPFTFTFNIDAKEETLATVRIFLGPKYNVLHEELDVTENYEHFYELDIFQVNLTAGINEIKRSSHEAHFVLPEQPDKSGFYNKLKMAAEKREPLTYSEHVYGFPERLLIPRGTKEGMTFQIFVHVTPCNKEEVSEINSPLWGKAYIDGRPLGYPFDRPPKINNFNLENMYFKDVAIYHKEAEEINATV